MLGGGAEGDGGGLKGFDDFLSIFDDFRMAFIHSLQRGPVVLWVPLKFSRVPENLNFGSSKLTMF